MKVKRVTGRRKKRRAEARRKAAELIILDDDLEVPSELMTQEKAKEILESVPDDGKSDDSKHIEAVVVERYDLPFGGAKSWNELEAYLEAEATSSGIRETEYEFRMLVNNVLNDASVEVRKKEILFRP